MSLVSSNERYAKIPADAIISLEHAFVKVPFEQSRQAFRSSQKLVEKDLSSLMTQLNDLAEKQRQNGGPAANEPIPEPASQNVLSRLRTIREKMVANQQESALYRNRCHLRLSHLNGALQAASADDYAYKEWCQYRLDRLIVDYLLRNGYLNSAKTIAAKSSIKELVNIELFTSAIAIEQSLVSKSCVECLAWCIEHRAQLKRINSTLEFSLRRQEFIELVRSQRHLDAIAHAKKFFVTWIDTHWALIQQCLVLLAVGCNTFTSPYKELCSFDRWHDLIENFRADNRTLNSLSEAPLLLVTLQAGLSVLKTPKCYDADEKNINCPVCCPPLSAIAQAVPFAHHENSCLVCRLTGETMDEDNPPMALPNGFVYSFNALRSMADQNGGNVTCPRTGQVFSFGELKKCFIS